MQDQQVCINVSENQNKNEIRHSGKVDFYLKVEMLRMHILLLIKSDYCFTVEFLKYSMLHRRGGGVATKLI